VKIVLDTNVVVSGFLSPHGPPAQILYRVAQGEIELLYDARILEEYQAVLQRVELDLPKDATREFLRRVETEGQLIIPQPLGRRLPDADDEAFLEVALEGHAEALVTGNHKHFPRAATAGISVLSPRDFLDRFRRLG
jgi:putative PIN family toxin of toxin-antitoxin system